MRKTFLAFITIGLMLTLAACNHIRGDKPLVITNDGGGVIATRLAEIALLNASGREVRIEGRCNSACTLYLSAKNVCVTTSAALGFHGAAMMNGGDLPKPFFEMWSNVMASHYPEGIAQWYMEEARHSSAISTITGQEAIDRGFAKQCRGG